MYIDKIWDETYNQTQENMMSTHAAYRNHYNNDLDGENPGSNIFWKRFETAYLTNIYDELCLGSVENADDFLGDYHSILKPTMKTCNQWISQDYMETLQSLVDEWEI